MPRAAKKDTSLRNDPIVLGMAGAYLVGMLMTGMIGVMTSGADLRSNIDYNQSKAAFVENGLSSKVDASRPGTGAVVPADSRNVILDPSFELPIIRSQSQIVTSGSNQLGWEVSWTNPGNPKILSLVRQPGVELLAGYQGWAASEGAQFARLDTADLGARSARTQSLVTLAQNIHAPAGIYHLSFDFAAQPKTPAKDNQLEVRWNGNGIATVSADGSKDSKPNWKNLAYTLQVTGTGDRLEIVGKGEENNRGILVDNFSLTPITR